jgi:hypothetical protein
VGKRIYIYFRFHNGKNGGFIYIFYDKTEYKKIHWRIKKVRKSTSETAKNNEARRFKRRIGNTTYRIGVHFNNSSQETIDDKIIRLVRNETTGRKAVIKK